MLRFWFDSVRSGPAEPPQTLTFSLIEPNRTVGVFACAGPNQAIRQNPTPEERRFKSVKSLSYYNHVDILYPKTVLEGFPIFRFGSARFASARFRSVRFGSIRFHSVRFALIQFGFARFRRNRTETNRKNLGLRGADRTKPYTWYIIWK